MANPIFSVDKPQDSLGLLLWQTTITWQRLIKSALEPYGIAHAQFVILALVLWYESTGENPTQVLIARQSKLDKMTVSTSLKKLAALGLIKRAEHDADTRAKSVRLTTKGKAITAKLVPIIENIDHRFFGVLSSPEQKKLISFLDILINIPCVS